MNSTSLLYTAAVVLPLLAGLGFLPAQQSDPQWGQVVWQEEPGQWHEVQEAESLRSIADFYYGSPRHWRTLQIANDADLWPPPGSRLWIPGMREEGDAFSRSFTSKTAQ